MIWFSLTNTVSVSGFNSIRQQDPNIYSDTEARCLAQYLGRISLPETCFYVKQRARPLLSFQQSHPGSRLLCCQVNRNVRPQVVIFKYTFIKVVKSSKSKRFYSRFGSYTSDAICQCSDTTKMGLCAIFFIGAVPRATPPPHVML